MLSEEEKKAITNLIDLVKFWKKNNVENSNDEILLNLIDKQQKEIEEKNMTINKMAKDISIQLKEIEKLKDKNKTLERLLQGELYEMYLYYKELASKYQANCISKDTIRDLLKQVNASLYHFKDSEKNNIVQRLKDKIEQLLEE